MSRVPLPGRIEEHREFMCRGILPPYSTTIRPQVILPATMGGQEVTFYAVVVQAGKMPPVSSPSELTPTTLYVIMTDKKTVTVAY